MRATRRPRLADPEFDPPALANVRQRDFDPLDHQRLVVNPFLAVVGLIGLIWLARGLLVSSSSLLVLVLFVPLSTLPYLVQFHCLDCERTEPFFRCRGHACPAVLNRWQAGNCSRFPTARGQLLVWAWVFGSIAVLLVVNAATSA